MPRRKLRFVIGERVRFNRNKFPLSSLPYHHRIGENEVLVVTGFRMDSEAVRVTARSPRRVIRQRQLLYLRHKSGGEVEGIPEGKTPYGFDSEFFVKAA